MENKFDTNLEPNVEANTLEIPINPTIINPSTINNKENTIDFKSAIKPDSKTFIKNTIVNNYEVSLSLEKFSRKVCDTFLHWQMLLGMLGKSASDIFFCKILYCLLSDCCFVNSMNDNPVELDLYDDVLERFVRLDTIDKQNRMITIKIYNVCDTMIVLDFDAKNKQYKMYEIYNLPLIKSSYKSKRINFDILAKDLELEPFFTSSIQNLKNDYKKLSVNKSNNRTKRGIYLNALSKVVRGFKKNEKIILELSRNIVE